jgi:hypothetical protein
VSVSHLVLREFSLKLPASNRVRRRLRTSPGPDCIRAFSPKECGVCGEVLGKSLAQRESGTLEPQLSASTTRKCRPTDYPLAWGGHNSIPGADVFQLSTNALRALDVVGAVTAERAKPAWGFPSRSMERATRGHEEEVANHLHGILKRGVEFAGVEVLAVPKAKGLRPLSALSFVERTIYRLLTQSLKENLDLPDRSYERYEGFRRAPLGEEGVTHIVRADVASFYQYIDHDLLHEEIVNQTGHAGAADSIVAVLHGVNQRRVGLPQLYDPSDWLSEMVIDRVERSMVREGFEVFRFNDDFRVACSSWGEANQAILKLDEELRPLGLVLNDDKTVIQTTPTYREWIDAPEKAWASIADELGLDIRTPNWEAISIYARAIAPLVGDEVEEVSEGEEDEAGDEELRSLWIEAAKRALEIWFRGKSRDEHDRLREAIDRRLLRQALKILTTARAVEGLEHCKAILTTEQHVSHLVGQYLKATARSDPDGVISRVSDWASEGFYISDWQRLWLMEPLLLIEEVPDNVAEWLRQTAGSRSTVVRGRALAVLVYKNLVAPKLAAAEIDSLTDVSAKDVIAAIASAMEGSGRVVESLRRQDLLTRLVVDYAGS